ncbi:MAG TPA: hypothetical protein VF152_01635 [Acidimicrobiia bacterium]
MTPRPWPAPLVGTQAHPDDVAPPWAAHVQGISHGSEHWFITQEDRLWRVPMALELGNTREDHPEVLVTGIPEREVDHLGDCGVAGERLYVAMEGTDPASVGIFDLDLRYHGAAAVAPQGAECPWCAIDPRDSVLYSSRFHADRLYAYRPEERSGGLELAVAGEVALRSVDGVPLYLPRVQGGAFSADGHLFVTSDVRGGGLLGVDVTTGECRVQAPIPYEPDWPAENVIEGLDVVDLTDGAAPNMSGVVHVLVFDAHGPRPDYVWLRHFDVADEADRVYFQADPSGRSSAGPAVRTP